MLQCLFRGTVIYSGMQRDKTKKIDVHPNDDTQNYTFCRLQFVFEMFRQS